ncbi:substrate-binding periplasmic protein [Planotetraspora kaengkrachanensis]|uniref:Amino acid ABC transporter substrate-binding protein n=1 Tax=Planotetraspora kaengkrachanensis TaxID=575193 RepID=A0A8J3PRT1_9ACTN|nr:transporter substrate-binding domain-containing protein [Planotetraspora kaengkrachanensis]GIG79532.1 amino acid ABC transporter substrate-binding protein [Planotetraspora kaengkrachanensis]
MPPASVRDRRRTSLRLATIALAVALAGSACGGADATDAATQNGADLGLIKPGTLSIAFRTDDKPASFLQDGKATGMYVDLMDEIAKRMGLKTTYVSSDFASLLPSVRNHRYDTAAFGVLVTPEREAVTNFTAAVSYGEAQLISLKGSPLATISASGGKTVAITRGSALIPLLQKTAPTVVIKEFPNIASSANALTAGQVDGLFSGTATVRELLAQHDDFTASEVITSGKTAFPVAKDKQKLLDAVNKNLDSMIEDGTYTRLFYKWNPADAQIPEELVTEHPGMPTTAPAGAAASVAPSASS